MIGKNSAVVVYLESPKEKYFGILLELHNSGIILRGLNLESFQTWMEEVNSGKKGTAISTFFFPWRRVVKMILDEETDGVESLTQRFKRRTGKGIFEVLLP